jgi:ribose 5-phosphate isomerase B
MRRPVEWGAMRKAKLTAGKARAFVWLNSTRSADTIWDSLPLRGVGRRWGQEVYFQVPVKMGEENARQVVSFGDVAYWPEGNCICVFFGSTPLSQGDEIRAASPVNILGRVMNDPRVFEAVSDVEVVLERVEGGVESIAIGTDEHTPLVDSVTQYLDAKGIGYKLFDVAPWPEVAEKVARSVASGESDEGILFCWTGTGVSLAANKIPGVRAALCPDATVAAGARKWNHANVLVMGLSYTSPSLAGEILDAWFSTEFDEDEVANVTRVAEIERSERG